MKVVILAGGLGTRLSELTEYLPKPMVKIGGKPILWHIMKTYNKHGLKNFFIAAGYKSEIIKEYFLNYRNINSDFTINLKTGDTIFHEVEDVDWTVTVADTGLNSMTGGRVKRMITVSAVHPGARFGELELKGDNVISFKEKPQTNQGWINGGYFVCEPSFLDLIENDQTILEKEPLENVAKMGQLMAYHHKGFWHCMDTKRDKEVLENLWISGRAPWK